MKANGIKAGVVYAYGQGQYDKYDAVVIVDADPESTEAGEAKYKAVRVPSQGITDEVIAALTNLSAEQGAANLRLLSNAGLHADLVTNRLVRGPWVDVIAERDRLHAAINARRAAERAIRDEEQARAREVQDVTLAALAKVGVLAVLDDEGCEYYCLDQAEADKLIERLGGAK